jgi:hypothetical protein
VVVSWLFLLPRQCFEPTSTVIVDAEKPAV